MIYFIVAKHNEDVLNNYLIPSVQKIQSELYLIEGSDNIYQKYNTGIQWLKDKELKNNDIVCFIHEDVKILDPEFQRKIEYLFTNKPEVGACGVIGTRELLENGSWWINDQKKLLGHIIQENQENNDQTYHLIKGGIGYSDEMVVVDGLMIAIRGSLINKGLKFDESYESFHLYDVTICSQVLEMGYKVACVDILLQHKSPGIGFLTKDWIDMRDKFVEKIKSKGYNFPLTFESFKDANQKMLITSAAEAGIVFTENLS